jgi:hypothetical protein
MGLFDANFIKNFTLDIKNIFNKQESVVEIAERKTNDDVVRFRARKMMEYYQQARDVDNYGKNIPNLPIEQIDEYRKQRFEYYISLLTKQTRQ